MAKNNFQVVRKNNQGVVLFNTDTGKPKVLLNPNGKGAKYALELKTNLAHTNNGDVKLDKKGNKTTLSKVQRSFRAGYLQAQSDNAKAYNATKGIKLIK